MTSHNENRARVVKTE